MNLEVREGVNLRPYNTFGLAATARWFAELHDDQQALEAARFTRQQGLSLHVLGGGSNVLLTEDVQGLVVKVSSRGLRVLSDDGERVVLEAEAGELWQDVVNYALQLGLAGLENLSLIPGTVGAAPIQNIGAYGVELQEVFAGLTALDWHNSHIRDFSPEDCAFGYRDSRFKHETGRWLVLRVRLVVWHTPNIRLEYGLISQRLAQLGISTPTPQDVSQVICAIRNEKLPDPRVLGNAGSFFKNPVISAAQAAALRQQYPEMASYPQPDGQVKVAAAWLIDQAGWKGFREGDAGVHRLQALVLVNHGQATGLQILQLARRIQADIAGRFGITLEMEPVLF